MRAGTRALLGLGAVLLLAGCGGGSDVARSSAPVLVTVTEYGFEPAAVVVQVGQEVRWVNQVPTRVSVASVEPSLANLPEQAPGTALTLPVIPEGGLTFDSGPLPQGQTFALRPERSGTFLYTSVPQEHLNWYGTLTVEEP